MRALRLPRCGEVRQISTDRVGIDRVGIGVGIVPLDHAFVVQVLRVGNGLQIGLVALGSADIRGWATALRADEARVRRIGHGRRDV